MKWAYGILFFVVLVNFTYAISRDGEVVLANGKNYHGKVSIYRPLYFHDVFRDRKIRLDWEQIATVETVEEASYTSIVWQEGGGTDQYKKYILVLTTWNGQRYWARQSFSVSLQVGREKMKLVLPETQKVKKTSSYKILKITFLAEENKTYTLDKIPSLEGKIAIQGKNYFSQIYALQRNLGVLVEGKIDEQTGEYKFKDIFPGGYDLFLVGDKAIVFSLSKTPRQGLMDREVITHSTELKDWVEGKNTNNQKITLLYHSGHYSEVRMIVLQQTEKNASVWLWTAYKRGPKWLLRNQKIIYTNPDGITCPRLLYEERLSQAFVKLEGQSKYNYFLD